MKSMLVLGASECGCLFWLKYQWGQFQVLQLIGTFRTVTAIPQIDHLVVPSFRLEEYLRCRCPLHFHTCQTISLPSFASLSLPNPMCENLCYLEKKSQSPITIYKNYYYYGVLSQDFTYIFHFPLKIRQASVHLSF